MRSRLAPKPRSQRSAALTRGEHYCSVNTVRVDSPEAQLGSGINVPTNPCEIFKKTRYWHDRNRFIRMIITLRVGFLNSGFRLRALSGSKADQKKLDKFLKDPAALPIVTQLTQYVREVWREHETYDNVISFWTEDNTQPIVLELSEVEYSDRFGMPVLEIRHKLTTDQIAKLRAPDDVKTRLRNSSTLKVTPEDPYFHFDVIKRAKLGDGLGMPTIYTVFQALAQDESMEAGDALWAEMGRRVFEQHKKGHAITNGPKAGMPEHFWKKKWADNFLGGLQGKMGIVQTTTNFDHEISYSAPDPKQFLADKYKGVAVRLAEWAAPFSQMLAGGINPHLSDLLKVQCLEDRERVRLHLIRTINEVFDLPVAVVPGWSNRCFVDNRMAAELARYGLASGPVSQTSYLEMVGLDPQDERERKKEEAELPDTETLPLFDASHGIQPARGGNPDRKLPGKPGGTQDKS